MPTSSLFFSPTQIFAGPREVRGAPDRRAIAKTEKLVTWPQMTWFVVSFDVVTSTHVSFSKWNSRRLFGSPNCRGSYVMQTLTGGTKVAVVVCRDYARRAS